MSEVKWIKLNTHMFEDEKIKLIEQMPDADTILVIWIKLLSQAGKTNASGYIFLSENIPYTDEMLATIFNRPLNTVRMALDVFKQFGMIEMDDNNFISVSNWEKHQNVAGLDKIREQTRQRVAKHREQKKLSQPKEERNVTVTQSNATEEELELEEEKEKKEKIPYVEIVTYLNDVAGTKYRSSTKKTQSLIKARYNEGFTIDDFKKVIDVKWDEWKNDQKMKKFIRPETLFSPKFEGYLNQDMNADDEIDEQFGGLF
ncbi:phage replisome organizer N-terminal domain-containing protein [Halobacillus karajensis]|uniref:Phage replisome organizer, putative, N-terminal region n=1 Tax=Halobacillus karajensis TaxID=195088 RepID=A0A059NWB3_9BACI|nr:phage replisome organizer N-terminal domain-containing protein [Halobacillus karajensis]CDQ22613.1 hypothetical protein BN983_00826 [Halobacillus karajensis]CDQ26095.1 hypothetical protein BN981_00306 [Halobacillus karajensis]